jgi:methionyl-tRNA formyltransferase
MKELRDCRIVFMGTPEFAVAILDKLVSEGCQVVGVVTAPDKPAGRGMQLTPSAVKKYALEKGLHILQPPKLKAPEFLAELATLNADLQVVVAFRMLPETVWNMPPLGTINLHASLLPKYRGAAPINWAIINGEQETGITTFKLQHAIDTGDVLMQQTIPIRDDETAGELHDEMKNLGATLVHQTLQHYVAGTLTPKPQADFGDPAALPSAPKIHTDTCKIDWSKSVKALYDLVRGLSPYPAAFTSLEGKLLKVFKSQMIYSAVPQAGSYESDGKTYLRFAAADGWLYLTEIQLEGKKRMAIEDFLRGYRLNAS